jgi:CBS domain-containing protein
MRDVMSGEVHGISEEASLLAAAEAMVEHRINSLVVWPTERDEPYGILTSSDVVDALAEGLDLERAQVADLKHTPLVLVTPGVRVQDAARMMMRLNLRHLAVFNGKTIVGVVSNSDLMAAAIRNTRSHRVRAVPAP